MKLVPCPFCGKPIPARMNACPYCRRDEKGEAVVMDSRPAVDTETPELLKQREQLLKELANSDPYVQEQAILRLSQQGPAVAPALMKLLSSHAGPALPAVARTLGMIADKRAIGALSQAVKQGDDVLRTAALWALAQFRDAEALPVLLVEAERVHPVTQSYLAHVLGGFQDPRVVPVLSQLALHGSKETRYQAAFALGEWHEPVAVKALKRTARSRDPLIRAAAAASLRRLGVSTVAIKTGVPIWAWIVGILAAIGGGAAWFYR